MDIEPEPQAFSRNIFPVPAKNALKTCLFCVFEEFSAMKLQKKLYPGPVLCYNSQRHLFRKE
jgi:hypothetical protein